MAQRHRGKVVLEKIGSQEGETVLKIPKAGRTYRAKVESRSGEKYKVVWVEKSETLPESKTDAQALLPELESEGRAAGYGIYFDFDRAVIQKESEPALKEIAALLRGHPSWKLFVVGRTDNVGAIDYDLRLSTLLAKAVASALISRYRIAPQRWKAYGLGYPAPAATNKTEEGRAKNRRVELVEQ